jgi:hypothetical protein
MPAGAFRKPPDVRAAPNSQARGTAVANHFEFVNPSKAILIHLPHRVKDNLSK